MSFPKIRISAVFVATIVLTACSSDVANRYYGTEKFPPREVETVELLSKPPQREYTVIADFQSRGETSADMRRKAAEIGADAVIVVTLGGYYDRSDTWAGQDSQRNSYSRITATAIKFK